MTQTAQMYSAALEPQLHRNDFSLSPSETNLPITPVMPHHNTHHPMQGTFDSESTGSYVSMNASGQTSPADFDMSNIIDFQTPGTMHDFSDHFGTPAKTLVPTPDQMFLASANNQTYMRGSLDYAHTEPYGTYGIHARHPASPIFISGMQEPNAVILSQQFWPFFQCNKVDRSVTPPKTASIYLEGLAHTLKEPDIWKAWMAQCSKDDNDQSNRFGSNVSAVPLSNYSREKLLANSQKFLHKALDTHRTSSVGGADVSPRCNPRSSTDGVFMLPPADVTQHFLKSYAIRAQPYYPCLHGETLDPNSLMDSGNASKLLVLLMLASGALSTRTVEAQYLASGLTEACRISLFDIVEKDISQARDVVILQSALLFTNLAVWSGDKWHMDVSHISDHHAFYQKLTARFRLRWGSVQFIWP